MPAVLQEGATRECINGAVEVDDAGEGPPSL